MPLQRVAQQEMNHPCSLPMNGTPPTTTVSVYTAKMDDVRNIGLGLDTASQVCPCVTSTKSTHTPSLFFSCFKLRPRVHHPSFPVFYCKVVRMRMEIVREQCAVHGVFLERANWSARFGGWWVTKGSGTRGLTRKVTR